MARKIPATMNRSLFKFKSQALIRLKHILSKSSVAPADRVKASATISGFKSNILEPVKPPKSFGIYPDIPLVKFLGQKRSPEDIVANILFRASQIFEETDDLSRRSLLVKYQSEIFLALNDLYREGSPETYQIFSIFNTSKLRLVSPALRPKRHAFLNDFVFQPILRFIFARPENKLDANLVLAAMGPRAFLKMRDAFFLEIFLLNAHSVEICMRGLHGEKGIFHDAVRFAFSFFPENFNAPLVPGSLWSLEKIFSEICDRQSPEMLRNFFQFSSPTIRAQALEFSSRRNQFTGLLEQPWAHTLIETISDVTLLPNPEPAVHASQPVEYEHSFILGAEKIYLVDSPESVVWLFREIQNENVISLNYKCSADSGSLPEFFSLATKSAAFIIDLAPLRTQRAFSFHAAVTFLFDFLLKGDMKKLLFNAENIF